MRSPGPQGGVLGGGGQLAGTGSRPHTDLCQSPISCGHPACEAGIPRPLRTSVALILHWHHSDFSRGGPWPTPGKGGSFGQQPPGQSREFLLPRPHPLPTHPPSSGPGSGCAGQSLLLCAQRSLLPSRPGPSERRGTTQAGFPCDFLGVLGLPLPCPNQAPFQPPFQHPERMVMWICVWTGQAGR